jgi:hypothetical protein
MAVNVKFSRSLLNARRDQNQPVEESIKQLVIPSEARNPSVF